MSYAEKNLLPGERIVYRAQLHWLPVYGVPLFLTIIGVVFLPMDAGIGVAILFLTIAAPLWLMRWLELRNSEFAVTTRRIVAKRGIISTSAFEMLLQKIEGLVVNQNPMGQAIGYGTLIVSGTGGSKDPFPAIADPLALRRAIQTELENVNERRKEA